MATAKPISEDDPQNKTYKRQRSSALLSPTAIIMSLAGLKSWSAQDKNGLKDFCLAQAKVAAILAVAHFGNVYEPAYPRNDNHAPVMFWVVNAILLVVTVATWSHKPSSPGRGGGPPRVIILGREQTEEWKGWMQWAFIFYHYYRVYYVYNEIRVFVSAYVWMTGFGNFLYFDKKADFSIERFVSMILRINYFPLLLSYFLTVPLELYYVVPLHTTGFVVTMISCYIGFLFETKLGWGYWKSRTAAVGLSLLAHVLFYETSAVNFLLLFSKEYHFRFQADKYSAWMGMACGLLWGKIGEYMQWAHGFENDSRRRKATILQFLCGVLLIWIWYGLFGFMQDKYSYNPVHPYVFILPVIGWLMIRNCSRYLTECHSSVLEFLGRNTLETYVLQFHLFMSHNVQYIPIVVPGSGPDGTPRMKFLNMVLCGSVFVTTAVWARKNTVATQLSVVDLVKNVRGTVNASSTEVVTATKDETVELTKMESGMSDVDKTVK
eukprot:CCRYP_002894-RA/>CCRYP_002894-RA protein AED:0.02 eAED:0.02 QI:2812/1/1/1/1/1/2/116/491